MSVNYNRLSAGKRPTRGQVKLLRRDAHAVLAAPAVPALQFQEDLRAVTMAATEGGCFAVGENGGITETHRQGGRC